MSQQNNQEEKAKSKESPFAVYMYTIVLTVVIGGLLSVLYNALKPLHQTNEEKARKQAILAALPEQSEEDPLARFDARIKVIAVQADGAIIDNEAKLTALNSKPSRKLIPYKTISEVDLGKEDKVPEADRVYPLYEYTANNGEKLYIISIRGNGLWDKIWGNIALKSDMSTIAGVYFGHKGETPGLGAEIKDSETFKAKFIGKTLFQNGEFKPALVKKKGLTPNDIQAISGATVTSDGVTEMLQRGIAYYLPYIKSIRKS
jgi:Na+-transporting NADH:ubiquinone oxidoreductase subunit C